MSRSRLTVPLCALLLSAPLAFAATAPAAHAQTIGSALVSRPILDGAVGQLYIFSGDTFAAGGVFSTFSFFAGNTGSITPLLLERTLSGPNAADDQYVVRGIGTARTVTTLGAQSVAFGLQAGTDAVTNGNYTFGFTHARLDAAGASSASTTGVVAFAQTVVGGPGVSGVGTNAFRFPNNGNYFGTLAVGTVFGAGGAALNDRSGGSQGFLVDRTYSAQANASAVAVPEAGTVALVAFGMACSVLARRRRK